MSHKTIALAQVKAYVEKDLTKVCRDRGLGMDLKVIGSKQEDEWLHLFVRPTSPKFSSEDYVRVLAEVEMHAEEAFDGLQLLLVPVSPPEKPTVARDKAPRRNR